MLQLVTCLMTVTLVIIFAIYAVRAHRSEQEARRVPIIVDISNDLFAAEQNFRLERGAATHALDIVGAAHAADDVEIKTRRVTADKALNSALAKLAVISPGRFKVDLSEIYESRNLFATLRRQTDAALEQSEDRRRDGLGADWIAVNGRLVRAILALSDRLDNEFNEGDAVVSRLMALKRIAGSMRPDSGEDRLLIAQALAERAQLSDAQREHFAALRGRIDGKWKILEDETRLPGTPAKLKSAIEEVNRLYFTDLRPKRDALIADLIAGRPPAITATEWRPFTAAAQESIFSVANVALNVAAEYASKQAALAARDFYAAIALMAFFSGVGVLSATYVFKGVVGPITKITATMELVADLARPSRVPRQRHRRAALASREGSGRGGQPRQVGISCQYEPRVAHAAQRHHRIFRNLQARDVRPSRKRSLSRLCPGHLRERHTSACGHQRHPGYVEIGGRAIRAA